MRKCLELLYKECNENKVRSNSASRLNKSTLPRKSSLKKKIFFISEKMLDFSVQSGSESQPSLEEEVSRIEKKFSKITKKLVGKTPTLPT